VLIPQTRYAKSGNVHIAYQVIGKGSIDFVHTPGSISHLERYWDEPSFARYLTKISSFTRLIIFDKRGTGLSDRGFGIATLEERMDDIRAVMDAANSQKAVIFGLSEGATMSMLFAATYPERTSALIVYGGLPKGTSSPDFPWASDIEEEEGNRESKQPGKQAIGEDYLNKEIESEWGTPKLIERAVAALAPSRLNDENFKTWFGKLRRDGATPAAALALNEMNRQMDVRNILPAIHVPTLVVHLTGDRDVRVENGRYIAEHIPGSKYIELPGIDHIFTVDEQLTDRIVDEISKFLTGMRAPKQDEEERILTTVLFSDIVGSTEMASRLGDSKWRSLLEKHDELVRKELGKHRGREIKNTGDGFLALFDGPTKAIRYAISLRDSLKTISMGCRFGIHTGECVLSEGDARGIAVHVAARVLGKAGDGEILVSNTVKGLVAGSNFAFKDLGPQSLKGVPGRWRLYSVEA
jgi:class 3 adenylate cyclase